MAWLNAVPDKKDRKGPGVSRLTTLTNKANLGGDPPGLELPPLDTGDHLIKHLFDVGPSSAGEVLTFSEIRAWVDLTGHVLTAWEAETLRKLSAAYLGELQDAKAADRPPPFSPEVGD